MATAKKTNSSNKSASKTKKTDSPVKNTNKSSKPASKSAPKNSAPKNQKNNKVQKAPVNVEQSRQRTAIVLLGIALIFLAATLIKGEHIWLVIHNFFFGLFGVTAFVWPLMLIYLAIVIATNRSMLSAKGNIIGASSFVVLLAGIIHVFSDASDVGNIGAQIQYVWGMRDDILTSRGGVVGALFGGLPAMLFGKTAAAIVLIVLLIVVFMLVTGTTLVGVWLLLKKSANKASDIKQRRDARREDDEEYINRKRKRFSVPDLGPEISEDGSESMFIEELVGNETKKDRPSNKKEPRPFIDISTGEVIETPSAPVEPVPADNGVANIEDIIRKDTKRKPSLKVVKPEEKETKPAEKALAEKAEEKKSLDSAPVFQPVYRKPDATILSYANNSDSSDYEEELKYKATKLVETLDSFGVSTKIVGICRGPSVTRFELQPAAGVKISKITSLADDLALALASTGVRIEAPIPNKSAVGIEVPNKNRSTVSLREIVETPTYQNAKSKLNVALGKDIAGNTICADIAKMPHLLIAGTTGSGKSVCLNAMIVSILMNATPDEVKLVMIDPKQVEFTVYNGIPHLLVPVVSDPRKAAGALGWAVTEMLQRYKMFSEKAVRDIKGYNRLAETDEELTPMPHIVIFIDELSDLMMAAPNEVEDSICRLAQMARAAGMHLVIATQRPSVNVITGIIKANIPSRIALSVSSQVDSRTILDAAGAEKLLGNGDMLFGPVGVSKPVRVQGCFLSDEEVEGVCKFIKNQSTEEKKYDEDVMKEIENQQAAMDTKKSSAAAAASGGESDGGEGADEMLPKAIEVVVEAQMASTTLLQRKLKLGYARAARIVDELEQRKIVGPFEGSKPRKVLISKQQWIEMNALGNASASVENPIEPNSDFDEFEDEEYIDEELD